MKKIIAAFAAVAMLAAQTAVFAAAPADYDGSPYDGYPVISKDSDGEINLAVIANGDVKIGNTMQIDGSVYSNGTIYARNGAGNVINGMFISGTNNETQYVSEWSQDDSGSWVEKKTYLDGYYLLNQDNDELFNGQDSATYGTKPEYQTAVNDGATSFDYEYEPFEVPTAPEYKNDNVWGASAEFNVYNTNKPANKQHTFKESAYVKDAFINGGWGHAIIVDTTKGDVNLIIDTINDLSGTINIQVVGDHEAYIYFNNYKNTDAWNSYFINRNNQADAKYYQDYPVDGAADHTHVFFNGDDVVFAHDQISAKDIHVNAKRVEISGATKFYSDLYTNAEELEITGGTTVVRGTVSAPYAASKVVDSGRLEGQLITNTLEINGAGSIIWKTDAAEKEIVEPTAEPTVEPTVEPTAEPAPEPEKEPLPSGKPIDLSGAEYAYIFGYEPAIHRVTVTDEEGNETGAWDVQIEVGPNDKVTREQIAAMIMRMIDQKYDTIGVEYPVTANIASHEGTWYERGLAYLASTGAFDGMDEVTLGPVTRGEVAKLVVYGLNLTETGETSLTDIADSPYKPYIEIMNTYGYMQGHDDGTFAPNEYMTRAQFCSMFNQILDREDAPLESKNGIQITPETYYFTDIFEGEWYTPVILRATSAYDADGYVDIETRLSNIRNTLDAYDSQKLF